MTIIGLSYGVEYQTTLTGPDGVIFSGEITGGEVDTVIPVALQGSGGYTATMSEGDWTESWDFTVENDCPPVPVEPTLVIDQPDCFVSGEVPTSFTVGVTEFSDLGEGQLMLQIEGTEFSRTVDVTEAGEVTVPLNGVGEYVLTLFMGETVYDTGELLVAACPPVPPTPTPTPTPVKPTPAVPVKSPVQTPMLAVTGADPITGLAIGTALLVMTSAALLLTARRRDN